MVEGVRRAAQELGRSLALDVVPLADGGEGTVDAVQRARGGTLRHAQVRDPLGRPIEAAYLLLDDGTAVVEWAAAPPWTAAPGWPRRSACGCATTRDIPCLPAVARSLSWRASTCRLYIPGCATWRSTCSVTYRIHSSARTEPLVSSGRRRAPRPRW